MASPDESGKRRPVDALFGDGDSPSAPTYIVEDPLPVTTVSPPPPDPTAPVAPAPPASRLAPAPPSIPTPEPEPEPAPARPAAPPAQARLSPKPVQPPPAAEPSPPDSPSSFRSYSPAPQPTTPNYPPTLEASAPAPQHATASYPPTLGPSAPASQPTTPGFPSAAAPSAPAPQPPTPSFQSSLGASPPAPQPTPLTFSSSAGTFPAAAPRPAPSRPSLRSAGPASAEPTFEPEPIVARPSDAPSDRIGELYERLKDEVGASRAVAEECMALLHKAREANSKKDYAAAEFYLESVEARLIRSEVSQDSLGSPLVWFIALWNLGMLGLCLLSLPMTFVLDATFFGLAVAPEALLLARAAAWGCIGATVGTFASMAVAIGRHEYDPANNWGYLARPIVGIVLGGVFFVLSEAGVVGGNIVVGGQVIGPIFLYVFAFLAGFGQDIIFESVWNLLRGLFRVQNK